MDFTSKKNCGKQTFASSNDLIQAVYEKEWTKISNPLFNMSAKERILHKSKFTKQSQELLDKTKERTIEEMDKDPDEVLIKLGIKMVDKDYQEVA